jgi:hypothetical protein
LSFQTTAAEATIAISESTPKLASAIEPARGGGGGGEDQVHVPTMFHASVAYSCTSPRRNNARSRLAMALTLKTVGWGSRTLSFLEGVPETEDMSSCDERSRGRPGRLRAGRTNEMDNLAHVIDA